jgi:hypothetical protein
VLALSWAGSGTGTALASAGPAAKVVSYQGYSVDVPSSWPVYNLAADPTECVRFNQHAVYLGQPGSQEDCPAHSVGRTEAILVEPSGAAGGQAAGGQSNWGQVSIPARGVKVTATWRQDPAVVERALGTHSLPPTPASSASGASAAAAVDLAHDLRSHLASAVSDPVYTGLGFDACTAPSASQMAAWGSSPYRAVGIYVGGANQACAQPNLTAGWVASEGAAGWHLIPTYVGLQAPGNSCGCASINPSQAAPEGTAAASDAVKQAKALGIGTGNPLYFDLEAYTPGGSTTSAVLTFLGAWTAKLHADGYLSGVYASAGSGASDLAGAYGAGYAEPNDVWFADWNGEKTTNSPYIPRGDWSDHQRLHQYSGGVNATYGGVTINIDGDYLDGATAGPGNATGASSGPTASKGPTISGKPSVGQTLVEHHGTWSGSPTSYRYQWEVCNSAGAGCSPILGATGQTYTLPASDLGHTIRVQETASNAHGAGTPAVSAPTGLVHAGASSGTPTASKGPTISGTPAVGQTLVEHHGTWSGSPTSYRYQWEVCNSAGAGCSAIRGATGQTYRLPASDLGHKIRVQETASNAHGAGTPAVSAPTGLVHAGASSDVPTASKGPTISGKPSVGQTLVEHHGTWSGSPTSYRYQWEVCNSAGAGCSAIRGATGQTYRLRASDLGHTIRVQETASNAHGAGKPAVSAPTGLVHRSRRT